MNTVLSLRLLSFCYRNWASYCTVGAISLCNMLGITLELPLIGITNIQFSVRVRARPARASVRDRAMVMVKVFMGGNSKG